jgi:hypothetical protein
VHCLGGGPAVARAAPTPSPSFSSHARTEERLTNVGLDAGRAQRARKLADAAAGTLVDEEKKEEEPAEPAQPEIVVPPAPTDEEVEEAKQDYESKMKVLKDEVSRLQGEKTKLFQLLKQQCAPCSPPPSHTPSAPRSCSVCASASLSSPELHSRLRALPPLTSRTSARRQTSNPSTTPRSPAAAAAAPAADRPQQAEPSAAATQKHAAAGSALESAAGTTDPRFRRGSASALAIAAAAEAAQAGMHMRMVPPLHSQQQGPQSGQGHQQQGIWPGARPSLLPTPGSDSSAQQQQQQPQLPPQQQQQQRYQQRPSMIPRQGGWSR